MKKTIHFIIYIAISAFLLFSFGKHQTYAQSEQNDIQSAQKTALNNPEDVVFLKDYSIKNISSPNGVTKEFTSKYVSSISSEKEIDTIDDQNIYIVDNTYLANQLQQYIQTLKIDIKWTAAYTNEISMVLDAVTVLKGESPYYLTIKSIGIYQPKENESYEIKNALKNQTEGILVSSSNEIILCVKFLTQYAAGNPDTNTTTYTTYVKVSLPQSNFNPNTVYVTNKPITFSNKYYTVYETRFDSGIQLGDEIDGTIDQDGWYYILTDKKEAFHFVYIANTETFLSRDENKENIVSVDKPTNSKKFFLNFKTKLDWNYLEIILKNSIQIKKEETVIQDMSLTKEINVDGEGTYTVSFKGYFFESCSVKVDLTPPELSMTEYNGQIVEGKEEGINVNGKNVSANTYLIGSKVTLSCGESTYSLYVSTNLSTIQNSALHENDGVTINVINSDELYKRYEILLVDSAGNEFYYVIYLTNTVLIKIPEAIKDNLIDGKYYTNADFSFDLSQNIEGFIPNDKAKLMAKAQLNGVEYESDSLISKEGEYTLKLESEKLGTSLELKFVIDKEAPFEVYNELTNKGYNAPPIWYNTEGIKVDGDGSLKETTYSFTFYYATSVEKTKYDGAITYATYRERTYYSQTLEIGDFQLSTTTFNGHLIQVYAPTNREISSTYVYIYRKVLKDGSTDGSYVAYQNQLDFEEALLLYAEHSIIEVHGRGDGVFSPYPNANIQLEIFYFDSFSDFETVHNNMQEKEKTTIEYSYFISDKTSIKLTGTPQNNGKYLVTETDYSNNTRQYYICIYNEQPSLVFTNANTEVTYAKEGLYINYGITIKPQASISFDDKHAYYSYATITVNGKTTYHSFYDYANKKDMLLALNESGVYKLVLYTIEGKASTPYYVNIYLGEIEDTSKKEYDLENNETCIIISLEIKNAIKEHQGSSIVILRNDEQLFEDDKGNKIQITDNNKYEYYFYTDGTYKYYLHVECGTMYPNNTGSQYIVMELKKEAPVAQLCIMHSNSENDIETSVNNTVISRDPVYLSWSSDKAYTATINGSPYTSGTKIINDGVYTIVLNNGSNKSTQYSVTIITSKPKGYFDIDGANYSASTIDSSPSVTGTNNSVSFKWDDASFSCIINEIINSEKTISSNYTCGSSINLDITGEKQYSFILKDLAGNTQTYYLLIDHKAPELVFMDYNGNEIANNSYINKSFFAYCNESNVSILLDGSPYIKGDQISYTDTTKEKTFVFVASDSYGNSRTYTIYYDNILPVLELTHVKFDGTTEAINNEDSINNKFIIDWDLKKEYAVVLKYTVDNETVVMKLDGPGFIVSQELNLKSKSKEDKKYEIIVTSKSGNVRTYNVYLSNTVQNVNLYINGNYQEEFQTSFKTNKSVFFVFFTGCTATLEKKDAENPIKKEYSSNSIINQNGIYNLIVTDSYGNTISSSFEINKTPPVFNLITDSPIINGVTKSNVKIESDVINLRVIDKKTNKEKNIDFLYTNVGEYSLSIIDEFGNSVDCEFTIFRGKPEFEMVGIDSNNAITKETVYFYWTNEYTASLNERVYKSGERITEDGHYTFIVTDKYGNTEKVSFDIDTSPIEYTIEGLNTNLMSNDIVQISFNPFLYSAKLNGEDCSSFVCAYEEGNYDFIISSIQNPSKTKEIHFSIDHTFPTIELSTVSSNGFTMETYLVNDVTYDLYVTNNSFSLEYNKEDICKIDNGIVVLDCYSGDSFSKEGLYCISVEDKAGNITIYYVEISKDEIQFDLVVENKICAYTLNEEYKTKENIYNNDVTVRLPEECYLIYNDEKYEDSFTFIEEGSYNIQLVNKLGTISTLLFDIDKTAPVIEIEGMNEKHCASQKVSYVISDSHNYTVFLNGEETENLVVSENGEYTICVMDIAGNKSEVSFEIYNRDITQLFEFTQNTQTNAITCENISDEELYYYIDDVEVDSINDYLEEGTHTITIMDKYGNNYQKIITISIIQPKNYRFNNIMTIIFISFILSGVCVFIYKRIKDKSQNPYKRK